MKYLYLEKDALNIASGERQKKTRAESEERSSLSIISGALRREERFGVALNPSSI